MTVDHTHLWCLTAGQLKMELNKLKSLQTGQRGATTRFLRKTDEARDKAEYDSEDLLATFENLKQQQKILEHLNEQISNLTEHGRGDHQ